MTLSRRSGLGAILLAAFVCGGGMATGWLGTARAGEGGAEREIEILARQFAYEPHRIVVDSGDVLRLRLVALDVVHGFYLEGHDLEAELRPGRLPFRVRHPSRGDDFEEVEEVRIVAGRPGKYRFRCSVTCGTLHPFMQGELVIRPNTPYLAGVAGACALTLGFFALMAARVSGPPKVRTRERRIDLLARIPWLDRWVRSRAFQPSLTIPMFLVLLFFLAAGLLGSPIGNRNIVVTVVWILWWFVLITLLVPFGGRIWCLACPIPVLGEWLARRRILGVRPEADREGAGRPGKGRRPWPRRLQGLWIANLLFLGMCTFSTILVTRPGLTAFALGGMTLAALLVHARYARRSFCRYLCPLNAWMSVYATTAMVEVRARDPGLCRDCRWHSCAAGSARAWRCPWLIRDPARLERNNYCGLCMECVKACPNRNMTLRARPFCSEVTVRGLDEAWMAMIMVTLVVSYTVTLLGPWGTVKRWANVTESGDWLGFGLHAGTVWATALLIVPGLCWVLSWLARRLAGGSTPPVREIFVRYSCLLVPLGLLAWVAFSFPLVFVNYTHVTSSLSDPFGWGWNLFGTADQRWAPLFPEWLPLVQIPLVLLGLALSLVRGLEASNELFPAGRAALRSLLPHGAFCTAVALVLLRLFAG